MSIDEFPPDDWQPTEEDRRKMREAPALDPDASLGGPVEERRGAEWMQTFFDQEPLEWLREMARNRGGLLRIMLERGVSFRELSPLIQKLSKVKRQAFRLYVRWSAPWKFPRD